MNYIGTGVNRENSSFNLVVAYARGTLAVLGEIDRKRIIFFLNPCGDKRLRKQIALAPYPTNEEKKIAF